MILSPDNLPYFLFENHLVDWETIESGSYKVKSNDRRNFCFVFHFGENSLFVKQCRSNDFSSISIFNREVEFYKLIQQGKAKSILKDVVPDFLLHNSRYNVLVLSHVETHQSFFESGIDKTKYLQIHTALKAFHSLEFGIVNESKTYPWVFEIANPIVRKQVGAGTNRGKEIAEQILESKALVSALAKARESYQHNCIVHLDLKFNNIILAKERVHIVDFETVEVGDSLWDIASLLYSFIFDQCEINLNLNTSKFLPYHPIIDNSLLIKHLQLNFFQYYDFTKADKIKIQLFLGCVVLRRLIEEIPVKEQAEKMIWVANDMFANDYFDRLFSVDD